MSLAEEFQSLVTELRSENSACVLAELNDLLTDTPGAQIELLFASSIAGASLANYVAAMVEQAAHLKGNVRPPRWTADLPSLARPVFAVPWMALRTHLPMESPVPFRRGNIFADSRIGDGV